MEITIKINGQVVSVGKQKSRITELEKFQEIVLKFLDFMGIREEFE